MKERYDIVIPIARKDIGFLYKVTFYIRKNLKDADKIFIITNKKNFNHEFFKSNIDEKILCLDENELINDLSFKRVQDLLVKHQWYNSPGWYLQQFLKLGFSLTNYANKYYLTWDSDTLPLSKIDFFDEGHPLFTKKNEFHPAYFETIENLLGLKKQNKFSYIAEHMIFDVDIVKEMLTKIEETDLEGNNWFEKCISACNFNSKFPGPHFSEFETYGTYCAVYHPDVYHYRTLNTFRGAGFIRGRRINDEILKKMSLDLDTASFELYDKPPFPYNFPYYQLIVKDKWSKFSKIPFNRQLKIILKNLFVK